MVQKAEGVVKATVALGAECVEEQPDVGVELVREGSTVHVTFGGAAVRDAWFPISDLQHVLNQMQREENSETGSYYGK